MLNLILLNEAKESLTLSEEQYKKLLILAIDFGYQPQNSPFASYVESKELQPLQDALSKAHSAITRNVSISLIELVQNITFLHNKLKVTKEEQREKLREGIEHCYHLHQYFSSENEQKTLDSFLEFLKKSNQKCLAYSYSFMH